MVRPSLLPILFVLLAALSACRQEEEPPAEKPAGEDVTSWLWADADAHARGIGIVHFNRETLFAEYGRPDTVYLHGNTSRGSEVVARFIFRPSAQGWIYAVAIEGALPGRENLLEFDYEESGIPIDSISADGLWVRATYGFDSEDNLLHGWIAVDDPKITYELWPEVLHRQPIYFDNEEQIHFLDRPGGDRQELELHLSPFGGYDYIMYPLELQGRWMRVHVSTPSDYCFDPEAPEQGEFWIQFLDPNGRPLVWYFTRGC